ncbi:hypothetical protein CspeluHIS016_0308400 [Cutaneotrichosporon spelunceum]|uniref:DNA binding protein Ncp1 n=1 Tax=Cutaneotrichosporon spelunceum TaxID=1672016 RepID=A0AAD3TU78_9TREE|nr:hypothetical protein CspeluHIS016_0308400 [Cutaneotrichosporon spelunceum]
MKLLLHSDEFHPHHETLTFATAHIPPLALAATTTLQLGLVAILSHPVLGAVYPEESEESRPPPPTPETVPDGIGVIVSTSEPELRSPTPYYTPGIIPDQAFFMEDDDLAGRTATLSVSDAGEREVNGVGPFPPTNSVLPTTTRATSPLLQPRTSPAVTSQAPSYPAFNVADRSFDKDPNVLRAEHATVSPAVYYRESLLREVPVAIQPKTPSDLAGAAEAVGVLHPGPSVAQRSLEGQRGDTRLSSDGTQVTSDDRHAAPGTQASVPQTSYFAVTQVPQQTDTVDRAQRSMSSAPNLASEPQSQPMINGVASQNDSITCAPEAASQNKVDTAQQPNKNKTAKAAGVGAAIGLAASGAARMLNSEHQAQSQGDYMSNAHSGGAPVSHASARALSPTEQLATSSHANGNGVSSPVPAPANGSFKRVSGQHVEGFASHGHQRTVSETTRANTAANAQTHNRPEIYEALTPSRSYINAASSDTQYQRPLVEEPRRLSTQSPQRVSRSGNSKFFEQLPTSPGAHSPSPVGAASAGVAGGLAGTALADHVYTPRGDPYVRPASTQALNRRTSAQQEVDGLSSRPRPVSAMEVPRDRTMGREGSDGLRGQLSPSASMRAHGHGQSHGRPPPIADEMEHAGAAAAAGLMPGQIASLARQQELQGRTLRDDGPVPYDRPYSQFGHRPEVGIGDWAARREEGRLARTGTGGSRTTVGRSGTVHSRRSGAFGRGAGLSVGTQPRDVLSREDIHERAEVAERILGESTLRRLQEMEKKEGREVAKMLKAEGKEQARGVQAAIAELKRLTKMQKGAIDGERKSQRNLTKWISRENRARTRFLKEKERYEKAEGGLRNAENDYEERRDHASELTAQVADRTQELDDMRAQKAADDREREVKLLAIKNPGHV